MANEIPQLQDTQPILNPVSPNSRAAGYEAFGKTLGQIAGMAEEKAVDIEKEESSGMYINSVANVEQVKSDAQIRLLKNPDQAQKIAEQTTDAMNAIRQNAAVNSGDRPKLNAYIDGSSAQVHLKATETAVRQNQHEMAFTHFANWGDQLKAYQDALITDHDKAEQLKSAMVSSLHGLVTTGALTPEQAASSMKTMSDVVGVAADVHAAYGNPETTAKDYHTIAANPLNRGNEGNGSPLNATTGWMIDYHNTDKTFQGVLADISNRQLPNPQAFVSLPAAERQHAIMAIHGTQEADGMINSGEPFPAIEREYKTLTEKGTVLSYKDQAKRNALGMYVNELKNGNYLKVMAGTPSGNAIMNDFTMRNSAIQNSPIDPAKKTEMLLQNKNKMVDESVSWGQGHHTPSDYIQPIPQADIANVSSGFELGKDPSVVMQTLGQYSKQNQAYVATAMKNPAQRMIVSAISLSGNDIPPQDKLDFIAANQTGRNYLNKDIDGGEKDKTMMTRIATNLAPAMKMVQDNYDFENGQALQNSMIVTTLKYAKYLAQKDNNIGINDKSGVMTPDSWKGYVDQASKIYASSYSRMSGTNWAVNPSQLPTPLTNSQLDTLADHVTNEGYKYLKGGRNEAEFESAIGRNPLRMIISPTNDLLAVDGNGKVYYSMPFTNNTLPYASESRKNREKELKRAAYHDVEQGVKAQLNVRLPEDANPQ